MAAVERRRELLRRESRVRTSDFIKGYKDDYVYRSPVGSFAANQFGLYDMGGNVWQWCSDWYDPNYYAASPERNPRGPEPRSGIAQRKASRGGSWRHHVKVSRCSARSSIPPDFHYADYGFRVACGNI